MWKYRLIPSRCPPINQPSLDSETKIIMAYSQTYNYSNHFVDTNDGLQKPPAAVHVRSLQPLPPPPAYIPPTGQSLPPPPILNHTTRHHCSNKARTYKQPTHEPPSPTIQPHSQHSATPKRRLTTKHHRLSLLRRQALQTSRPTWDHGSVRGDSCRACCGGFEESEVSARV